MLTKLTRKFDDHTDIRADGPCSRYVTLAGGQRCSLRVYIDGVRTAITNPDLVYPRGLSTESECTGSQIRRQFRRAMNDRINQRIPYRQRGSKQ